MAPYNDLSSFRQQLDTTLRAIAQTLSVNLTTFFESEVAQLCSITRAYSGPQFLECFSAECLETWYEVLGSDLYVSLNIEEHETNVTISARDRSGFDQIHQLVTTRQTERVEVNVTIRKDLLTTTISQLVNVPIGALFFNSDSLLRSLSPEGIQGLRQSGVMQPDQHCTIVILDASGMLGSSFLSIIGLLDASPDDFTCFPPIMMALEKWQKAVALRKITSNWAAPLDDISPDTFRVEQLHPGLDAIYQSLIYTCNALSFLQFCAAVRLDGRNWRARIAPMDSQEFRIELSSRPASVPLIGDGAVSMYSIFQWAFLSEGRDKIDIIRKLFKDSLKDKPANVVQALLACTSEILEAAEATYAILCLEAFNAYMSSRREVEDAIESFVTLSRKSISGLTEELLATMFQFAAGALAFIATNLLNTSLSQSLKAIGVGAGLIYIALIFVFRLGRTWEQHLDEKNEVVAAIDRHPELLDSTRSSFKGSLEGSIIRFRIWFMMCAAVYICAEVLLLKVFLDLVKA